MSTGKSFDPSTVSRPTWIAGGGALVLFISAFLSWYNASAGGRDLGSESGWDSGSGAKLVALLALIALAALGIELFAANVTLPLPSSLIVIGAGGLSVLLVLLKFVDKPADGGGVVSWGLAYGIFVALIAAVVTTVGGYLKMQEA